MRPALSRSDKPLRLAIVTNIPAPYRVPVYNRLAHEPGIVLHAFYAARTEPDRQWDLPDFEHAHTFVKGKVLRYAGRFIHYNPGIWKALRAFAPDVVVTTGYNPTHLTAWLFAVMTRRRHVVMTDGTDMSERGYSWMHRAVRRMVFAGSQAFVVAGEGGWRLLQSHGVAEHRIHSSPLSANTSVDWRSGSEQSRDLDFLFSGRLVPVKNAVFAIQVAAGVGERLGRTVRMAVLGDGPQHIELRAQAVALAPLVEVQFAGNVAQANIPAWFQRARVFLFPTQWDPWGVVANEACLAGLPVIVSPHAGAAGELIVDGVSGRILPLDLDDWIVAAAQLLSDLSLQQRMSEAALAGVAQYNFDNAALGIADAARQAASGSEVPGRANRFQRPHTG